MTERLKIAQWAEEDRPREKMMLHGASALSNAELLAIAASFIQLTGYGTGFLRAWWKRCVCGKSEFAAFEKNFYK